MDGLLHQLISIFKFDYDTIRELERKGFRVFYAGALLGFVGLVLTLFGALMFLGVPLLLLGAGIFFVAMIWMAWLGKKPVRHLFCPYCATKNDVFMSRKEFACDICGRRVLVSPAGHPIPAEPIEDDD